jgi:hypothetical protein
MAVEPLFEDRTGLGANDLSSLACLAAIELDEAILGRESGFESARNLAEKINSSLVLVQEGLGFDPTAVVIMSRAIQNSCWLSEPATKVEHVITQAGEITRRLLNLTQSGLRHDPLPDLARLRSFCVVLSKVALAARGGTARID